MAVPPQALHFFVLAREKSGFPCVAFLRNFVQWLLGLADICIPLHNPHLSDDGLKHVMERVATYLPDVARLSQESLQWSEVAWVLSTSAGHLAQPACRVTVLCPRGHVVPGVVMAVKTTNNPQNQSANFLNNEICGAMI
jgi:hypothetical protein